MMESPSLDPEFRRPGRRPGIDMTDGEAESLLRFLGTLEDESVAIDPRYADPFSVPGATR